MKFGFAEAICLLVSQEPWGVTPCRPSTGPRLSSTNSRFRGPGLAIGMARIGRESPKPLSGTIFNNGCPAYLLRKCVTT